MSSMIKIKKKKNRAGPSVMRFFCSVFSKSQNTMVTKLLKKFQFTIERVYPKKNIYSVGYYGESFQVYSFIFERGGNKKSKVVKKKKFFYII